VTKLQSIDALSPEAMRALVQELEIEAERRRQERVAKGEYVAGPRVVAGHADSAAHIEKRISAEMRAAGERREVIFDDVIITGVPRAGRDDLVLERWPTGPV
jgi:hypothetical protein